MYSRGNVTEKRRFGQELVQKDEIIVDMYAGIGYYTLPALIHGNAKFVHACEWNPDAIAFLKYNLEFNGVSKRAKVYEGDCRLNAHLLEGIADRVSLGLLPSSEGGWKSAIKTLNFFKGGWLHIHSNVPVKEKFDWMIWVCKSLTDIVSELNKNDWAVICHKVERVKSFAPHIDHMVADIFVGPRKRIKEVCLRVTKEDRFTNIDFSSSTGYVNEKGYLVEVSTSPSTFQPSCALRDDGPLHQDWMRFISQ